MADNQEHQKFDAGGVDDSGTSASSKKFRSKSCPPRLVGSRPAHCSIDAESENYSDNDKDILIGDFFFPTRSPQDPPTRLSWLPPPKDPKDEHDPYFYPSREEDEEDTEPVEPVCTDPVQLLLNEVTEILDILLETGQLRRA